MSSSPATMFATRSIQRSRQTRRSACDRCRTYKLRCERSLAGGSECERCARTSGATCTTTTTKPPPGSRLLIAKSPVPCLRPPHAAILPPPTPVGQRASAQEQEQQRQRQGSGMLDLGMPSPVSSMICHRVGTNTDLWGAFPYLDVHDTHLLHGLFTLEPGLP